MRKSTANHALRLALLLVSLAGPPASRAAFLLLPGIPGGSTDAKHLRWIDITSFGFNVRPSGSELVFVKAIDSASPLLSLNCAQGSHLTSATLQFSAPSDDGSLLQYEIRLTDVSVAGLNDQGIDSSATEQCSLRFGSLSWNYFEPVFLTVSGTQNPGAGTITLQWSAVAGKTYDILGSSQVIGASTPVTTVTATNTGPMTATVPANGDLFFYRLRTSP